MNNISAFTSLNDFKYIDCMLNNSDNCDGIVHETNYDNTRLEESKRIMKTRNLSCKGKDIDCERNMEKQIDMYVNRTNKYYIHIITTTAKRNAYLARKKCELIDFLKEMYPLQKIVLYEVDTRKLTSDQFLWSLLENNTDFFTISESGAKYIVENKLVNKLV